MELVQPAWGLIFWTIVTFLVLLYILKKLAWKPILDMLEDRENTIRNSLEEAEKAREEAKAILEKNNRILKQAHNTSAEIIEKSKAQAESLGREIQTKAQEESERLLERAKEEIDREKKTALNALRKETVSLSLSMAEKLIRGSIDTDVHKKLIDSCIQDLESLDS